MSAVAFPPPHATRADVDAWYDDCGLPRPSGGEWHSFAGSDACDAACRGWDGVSRRCDCGNRRVYWDTSENPPFARAD